MQCPTCKSILNSRYKCPKCERQWSYEYLDGYWDGYDRVQEDVKHSYICEEHSPGHQCDINPELTCSKSHCFIMVPEEKIV